MNKPHYRIVYKNHGDGKIGFWEAWVEEPDLLIVQHATSMEAKSVRRETQVKGKNIGKANETSPMEQAVRELESKRRSKLDKGYVPKYEDAIAGPATNQLDLAPPMLAKPIDKVKPEVIEWDQAWVQPKLDGHRALFKSGVLYSRGGKEIVMPHISDAIRDMDIDHLHLDGELYIHGLPLQDLSRLIKKPSEDTLLLKYCVYDLVSNEPYSERQKTLKQYFAGIGSRESVKLVHGTRVYDMDTVAEHHAQFREQGYEGTMLRWGSPGYHTGKRSSNLLKIKEFEDAEFKVIGVEEGKPYVSAHRTYRVPVWVCDAGNGKTFNVTAQGNQDEKDWFWSSREQHIGLMLTVKYHYLSKDGIPQLPIALRFREDI